MTAEHWWLILAIAAMVALAALIHALRNVNVTPRRVLSAVAFVAVICTLLFPETVGDLAKGAWQRGKRAVEHAGADMPLWLILGVAAAIVAFFALRNALTVRHVVWGLVIAAAIGALAFPDSLLKWMGDRVMRAERGLEQGFALTPEERAAKSARDTEHKAARERREREAYKASVTSASCTGDLEVARIVPVPDRVETGLFGQVVAVHRHPGINIGAGKESCALYWSVRQIPGIETCADFRTSADADRICAGRRGRLIKRGADGGVWVRSATPIGGNPLPVEICVRAYRVPVEGALKEIERECNPKL